MKNLFCKTLLACAATAALTVASSAAMAQSYAPFTVNETSVSGVNRTFTADRITGNYVEVVTFTGKSTFAVSLLWNAGQFVNSNSPSGFVGSYLNGLDATGYTLYGLYQGNGTFSTTSGVTTFSYTPGGSLSVFADINANTTFTQPASGVTGYTTAFDQDDKLIATGVPSAGFGTLDPTLSTCRSGGGQGINCGSFGSSTTFSLSSDGQSYFTAPNPFYNVAFQSGQLNKFSSLNNTSLLIDGSMDVVFSNAVPEPASAAIVGLGLLGLGLTRRRKAVK